jgi:ABC-2 type transport system ATP-binding protein
MVGLVIAPAIDRGCVACGRGERSVIRVEDYSKSYRDVVAVSGLSFRVESGAILGLVGPNGAGKTTTLRALAGIIRPTQGRLFIADHDIFADPLAAKRELAYIPDDPKLFNALTVWEHLEFVAAAYRVADFEPTAEALLRQFELEPKRDALVQELSRGMRQKVAICCGYLHGPRAILFDEPLTGLDPYAIRTLKSSIAERAAGGSAVIISSHLLSLVEDLCTHLLILTQGQKLFFGTLAEARSHYADLQANASLEELFFRATERRSNEANLDPFVESNAPAVLTEDHERS